jgi:uncharacterized protein
MVCDYCFYADIMNNRLIKSYGAMTLGTLQNIIKKSLQFANKECTFAFQGGEPTLVGLNFYRQLLEFQLEFNKSNIDVHYAIQTNGLGISEEWAEFFTDNDFLVGISIDGNKQIHDSLRRDRKSAGTYERIKKSTEILDRYKTKYNILSVVTAQVASKAQMIYNHYKKNGWSYIQFIPCLDPLEETRGTHDYSVSAEKYGDFLKELFDLWYRDVSQGKIVYIRYFENLVGIILGYPPESCGMSGVCSRQYVVEADGSIYPCDFYVMDMYKLGNINTDNFEQLDQTRKSLRFIEQSSVADMECRKCDWYILCRGGCRRDRETPMGFEKNYFCAGYKRFFPYVIDRLVNLAKEVNRSQG